MKTPTANEIGKTFPFMQDNPNLINEVLTKGMPHSFPEGANLYWEGDACSNIVFLMMGEIRVYKSSPAGREITLYEIGPGDTCILNASCIISNNSYPANAKSITPVYLLLYPASDFKRLLDQYNEIRSFVFNLISERFTAIMTLLEEVVFNRMDERLYDYLLEKSENGHLETTHQIIANNLGTSREVISRLLKDMEHRKRVALSRHSIRLLDI